jgi:hypothetical protein
MFAKSSCLRACLGALIAVGAAAITASGQTSEIVLSTTHPVIAFLSGSGRVILVGTDAPLDTADSNQLQDLYLYDRDAPAWRYIPRSRLLDGVPSFSTTEEAFITPIAISASGRYVAYIVAKAQSQYSGYLAAIGRYDVQTDTVAFAYTAASPTDDVPPGPRTMSADGSTFAWLRMRPDRVDVEVVRPGDPPRVVGQSCRRQPYSLGPSHCTYAPALSSAGDKVLYMAGPDSPSATPEALALVDTASGQRMHYPEFRPTGGDRPWLVTSSDAAFVAATGTPGSGGVFDVAHRGSDTLERPAPAQPLLPLDVSDDGLTVLAREPVHPNRVIVYDRGDGTDVQLGSALNEASGLSDDGKTVLTLDHSDPAITVVRVWSLDADHDGMSDAWETRYGLSPSDAGDATVDSDGDQRTNLQEFAVRSHPTAPVANQRLFAEGAGGNFFDTLVQVFNPGTSAATVVVGFLGADGTRTSRAVSLLPKQRTTLGSCCIPTLFATEFAILVESSVPVTAEREMSWDLISGYGSHATAGTASAAPEWYFAEGATIAGMQLFYLLANPAETDAAVIVEYLLQAGRSVTRTYTVPAHSRRTIWVNQEGAPLDNAEVAAHVMSSVPIVAERSLYLTRPGQLFAAGSASAGVPALATTWTFAEGATGAFFDTFILVANPLAVPARVEARYRLPDGREITRGYTVAPQSRMTIWIDQEDAALAETAVSTYLSSDSPVVAERAMWWPGPTAASWVESHAEVGATAAGTRWAVASASAGPWAPTSTFLLIGNGTAAPGRARVTLYTSSGGVAATRDYDLPPTSRTTAWLTQDFLAVPAGTYSAIVESMSVEGQPPVAIVVERASYTPDVRAGSAVAATRVVP